MLKQETQKLVEDNNRLHEELKKDVVREIMRNDDDTGITVPQPLMEEVSRNAEVYLV